MSFRSMQIHRRKKQRRLDRVMSYLLSQDAAPDKIIVYACTSNAGFPYKGLITTPCGALRFGAGSADGITQREFKFRLKMTEFKKISFKQLIKSWHRGGLWEHRIIEQQLVDAWMPRLVIQKTPVFTLHRGFNCRTKCRTVAFPSEKLPLIS